MFYSDTSDRINNFTFTVVTLRVPVLDHSGNLSLRKVWKSLEIYIQYCVGTLRAFFTSSLKNTDLFTFNRHESNLLNENCDFESGDL